MKPSSLLGLTLEAAKAILLKQGFTVQVETTGCLESLESTARVVRANQTGSCFQLTVVHPPTLQLDS